MTRRSAPLAFACLVACTALLAARPVHAQTLELTSTGGGTLGGLSTLTVEGTPGDQYIIILSLSTGPTPLPPPNQPSTLDVGLELFTLSFSIPGFTGNLDASGSATAFLPIPFDAVLLAVPSLNFQAVRIVNNAKIDGKSNLCQLFPALPQTTEPTATDMSVLRAGHQVIKLDDGSLLFFGGGPDGNVASFGQTEVDHYDPCTQTFTQVGNMLSPRTMHQATELLDGRIMVTGGADSAQGEPIATAEIYDPTTHTSAPVPNMSVARAIHTASLLPDGRVIVMGGTASFMNPTDIIEEAHDSTEIYDPTTNQWTPGPALLEPRVGHRADTLQNGTVMVTGGYSYTDLIVFKVPRISDSAEIYIPGGGIGAFSASIPMNSPRFGHTSVVADNGRLYLFGGATDTGSPLNPVEVDTIERYDTTTGQFIQLVTVMSKARGAAAVAKIPGDLIVICGGSTGNLATPSPDDTVDLFDVAIEGVTNAYVMQHVRSNFSATLLDDGTILLAGGGDDFDPSDVLMSNPLSFQDAEILHP